MNDVICWICNMPNADRETVCEPCRAKQGKEAMPLPGFYRRTPKGTQWIDQLGMEHWVARAFWPKFN